MMEGSGSVQLMMDPDPEGPKPYGSYGSGSGSEVPTLVFIVYNHYSA
jgi:hypothetical protein